MVPELDRTPDLELCGATLIDGLHAQPLRDAVIAIRGGRILSVRQGQPSGTGKILDLRGRYIMPALIDSHAHAEEDWVLHALLAMGITTIRNPATATRARRPDDAPIAVRAAGPIIDGPSSRLGNAIRVADAEDMRAEVRTQANAGVDYIKLYDRLPLDLVRAGVDEAHQLGLKVIGDLAETSWTDAARAGIDFLCHAVPRHASLLPEAVRESYCREVSSGRAHALARWLELVDLEGPELAEMTAAVVEHGVAVDPTLVSLEARLFCGDPAYHAQIARGQTLLPAELRREQQAPELSRASVDSLREQARPVWRKVLDFVALLHRSGVELLAGSDAPRPWVVPGASLHRELGLLVDAGLSPHEALQAATGRAAAALGMADETGTIAPNKRADLVVLREDPSVAIANTSSIEWVVKAGVVHTQRDLRARYD